jgi:hypothetical protein
MTSDEFERAILNRIPLMVPPVDAGYIPKTTPVISFGDVTNAKIATLGINPSSKEFLSGGKLLQGENKRLADNEEFEAGAMDILFQCRNYFLAKNAYWSWFQPLEDLLVSIGETYMNYSSACHLDLSPWATFPAFRDLTKAQKDNLLDHDKELLPWLLGNSSIKTLILNGRFVYETVKSTKQFKLEQVGTFEYLAGGIKNTSELIMGESSDGRLVLGWTLNLQAMQTSSLEREFVMSELATWLKAQIGKG